MNAAALSTSPRHDFAGWEPAEPVSETDGRFDHALHDAWDQLTPDERDLLTGRARQVEGDLVPVCACGWRGRPEEWQPAPHREPNGGLQHSTHKNGARIDQAAQEFAAVTAAATLVHAAEDWEGDADVSEWLRPRAQHVRDVGLYDGQTWP